MKIKDIVNRDLVNLQNCDQEPIHIPGSIQPHGFLIAARKDSFNIRFCSGNIADFTGLSYQQVLGKSITDIFGAETDPLLRECLLLPAGQTKSFKVSFHGKNLECMAHLSPDGLVIEGEATSPDEREQDLFGLSKQFIGYMEGVHTLKELCSLVTEGIRNMTGYDRVMVYYFDKEYNGEVIAESKREDLESFFGLHYPHTDIPAQARELYIRNLLRIIVDVNYQPVPIYTVDEGVPSTLDLSHSVLRSVSPIHVQYLHNMGVGATLTISLMHKKKLWGLIACHHYAPKHISHEIRMAARLQGHFITSQIDVLQVNEEYDLSRKVTQAADALISRKFDPNRDSFAAIAADNDILRLCDAAGVSIVVDSQVYKNGLVPDDRQVLSLAKALADSCGHTPFHTHAPGHNFLQLREFPDHIPGINYFPLDQETTNCIIWYRPETVTEVNWAGDPARAIEKDRNGLSPRKSFELWKQTVKGQSKPWHQPELTTSANFANVLQKHMVSVFLAEEEEKLRALTDVLTQTNAELENINWISTHDLQEPLRKIQIMSSYILEEGSHELSTEIHDKVTRMNNSARRMQALVKDILKYTRLNYSKEAFEDTDLDMLMAEVKEELQDSLKQANATFTTGTLPVIKGVPFLLKQLFSNLVYNSLKFAAKGRAPEIRISLAGEPDVDARKDFYLLRYTDNGIGFDPKHNESVFNIFSRLHSASEYNGSGIGLALCRKIMTTHGGAIKAEGMAGTGVEFLMYFPVMK